MERFTEKYEGWNVPKGAVNTEYDMASLKCFDKLAEYEQAEEDGLLIRLPCKVGDTVYTACSWGIEIGVVGSIQLISDRVFVNNIQGAMIGEAHNIFLTKAEAEQALAKMKG